MILLDTDTLTLLMRDHPELARRVKSSPSCDTGDSQPATLSTSARLEDRELGRLSVTSAVASASTLRMEAGPAWE